MCGIVGIIDKCTVDSKLLDSMTDSLKHRGPDGRGVWIYNNVGFGHRRLSIIDKENGQQPMKSDDEEYVITYNGEIYNCEEIRKELVDKGYKFKTRCDTEVVLNSYIEWGKKCVDRFRGMFAFAVLDKKKEMVFLARDHFGIKPLVYYYDDSTFAFASEIQALRMIPNFDNEISLEAIDHYLLLQYIPAPKTAYKRVFKLEPGNRMAVSFRHEILYNEAYWRADFAPSDSMNEEDWLQKLDEALQESVEKHLISDVDFGAFLSGGVDSSLVSLYMTKVLQRSIDTFTVGFKSDSFDESEYANVVAKKIKANEHISQIKEQSIDIIPQLVKAYGEPFADSSAIPTYYVSRWASKHVPMILSGDGADEFFAGYSSYSAYDNLLKGNSDGFIKTIKSKLQGVSKDRPQKSDINSWIMCINYFPYGEKNKLWKSNYQYVSQPTTEVFEKTFVEHSHYDSIHLAQILDINTYLPNDILTKVDIASMQNSLEVRTPFIDINFFDAIKHIPTRYNYSPSRFPQYKAIGKKLPKKLLSREFDEQFVYRKKQGFAVPGREWMDDYSTFSRFKDELVGDDAVLTEYFNYEYIERIVESRNFALIYMLYFLSIWLKTC